MDTEALARRIVLALTDGMPGDWGHGDLPWDDLQKHPEYRRREDDRRVIRECYSRLKREHSFTEAAWLSDIEHVREMIEQAIDHDREDRS